MTVSSLSHLSTCTANEIGADYKEHHPTVRALLSIDDWAIAGSGLRYGMETFVYERLHFYVHYEMEEEKTKRLMLSATATCPAEFRLLYQLRVHVGRHGEEHTQVVDRLVAEFVPDGRSISISLNDENIQLVKLEMRTINKFFRPHPLFNESGDVDIIFSHGGRLRTWKAVLAHASPYFAQTLADDPTITGINVGDFPVNSLVELLLQLYPAARPIYTNFETLAPAAVGFYADSVIHQLNRHLLDSRSREGMEGKWKLAIDLELVEGVKQLVQMAVEGGYWDQKLAEGWKPTSFFSQQQYDKLVTPVVNAARRGQITELVNPWKQPSYFQPGPFKSSVLFRGTRFHIPTGVLQLHGSTGFEAKEDGTLIAQFSREMELICGQSQVVPGKVLVSLVDSLLPGGPAVPAQLLRAAVVFCFDHKWQMAKEQLEQRLMLEPPQSVEHFGQQLVFAERFQLYNMARGCLFRAESSAHAFAAELAAKDFPGASAEMKAALADRLCSGWSLQQITTNLLSVNKGTEEMDRQLKGGPLGAEKDTPTMAEIVSDYVFGPMTDFTKEQPNEITSAQ